jgi:hypothetical protein
MQWCSAKGEADTESQCDYEEDRTWILGSSGLGDICSHTTLPADTSGVYVSQHATDTPTETAEAATGSRFPVFSASDHVRLLHVLIDARMTNARRSLSRPRDRDELDREPQCPWDTHNAPLFNNKYFAPQANTVL